MNYLLAIFLTILTSNTYSQLSSFPGEKYSEPRYGNFIKDKNFYLLTIIDKTPVVKLILPASFKKGIHPEGFRFTATETDSLNALLSNIYTNHTRPIDELLNKHVRTSGNYILFDSLNNQQLWLKAWQQYFTGINYIIDQYGLGKKMRYPNIDSASYEVSGRLYQTMLKSMFTFLQPKLDSAVAFYENPLTAALTLMELNNRDEPARHEPLELSGNNLAVKQIKKTDFLKYKYATLVVPGDGPAIPNISLAPMSRLRCQLAAEYYNNKLAPFIILTGGYCHPFQTPFAEAVEMKKYLISALHIPEKGIIIDPHARHTTTNFRNAGRYIIRYGLPQSKPSLLVTTLEQADYIMHPKFDERNIKELGYLPYRDKKRISHQQIEFFTVPQVLHRDPTDPLDP